MSTGYGVIVGGEYPKHIIPITTLSKEEAKVVMDRTDPSSEVKICVMTFQNSPAEVAKSEITTARPHSNNESNEFVKAMKLATVSALTTLSISSSYFINFSVDGVSCESRHIWLTICRFLSYKINH